MSVLCNITVVESAKQYGLLGRDVLDNFLAAPLVINNVAPDVSEDWTVAIQQATSADELAQAIIRRIKADDWKQLQPRERPFFRVRHQLSTDDGLLLLARKCYIPLHLRKDVFDSCHRLHTGIHPTTNRIKLTSWWPTLGKDMCTSGSATALSALSSGRHSPNTSTRGQAPSLSKDYTQTGATSRTWATSSS